MRLKAMDFLRCTLFADGLVARQDFVNRCRQARMPKTASQLPREAWEQDMIAASTVSLLA